MPAPSSSKFDLLDWNLRADQTSSATDGKLSDAPNSFSANALVLDSSSFVQADGFVTLQADAENNVAKSVIKNSAQVSDALPSGVPATFTFEFDIFLTEDTPKSFNDIDDRIFVGAINQQGYTAGFLFSYDGIAVASHPEDPSPTVLGGGKDLLFDSNGDFIPGVNVRGVLDGDTGRLAIFVGSSDDVYATDADVTDAELKYNIAAKKSVTAYGDCVYVQVTAPTALKLKETYPGEDFSLGRKNLFSLGSIRLAGNSVLPQARPVAALTCPFQVLVGAAAELSGSNSFDPGGKNIDFNWEVEVYPEGSTAAIQGAINSFVELTVPGPLGPESVVRLTYTRPTATANGIVARVEEGPLDSSLSLTWSSSTKELVIYLGRDAQGNITTSAADLVNAFRNNQAPGYDIQIAGGSTTINFSQPTANEQDGDESTNEITFEQVTYPAVFTAELTTLNASGTEKLSPGVFQFAGGTGSNLMNPIFVPDKPGTYVFSLVVNNGDRNSFPSTQTLTAAITEQLLMHRPNSDYLWKYIGDFWKLVPDKHQISSIWSAMTQAVSSELLACWQHDYAKSIRDISRRYQRRWLHYPAKIDFYNNDSVRIVYTDHKLVDVEPITSTTYLSGYKCKTSEPSVKAPISQGKALLRTTLHRPQVVSITSVDSDPGDPTSWVITTSKKNIPSYEILGERTGGYFIEDPEKLTQDTPARTTVFTDPTYSLINNFDENRDVVRIFDENGLNPQIATAKNIPETISTNSIRLDVDEQLADGFARRWDHLRKTKNNYLEQTPYITLEGDTSLAGYSVSLGDYLNITVNDPYISDEVAVSLPILSSSDDCIFVEWYPLLAALTAQASLLGQPKDWKISDLVDITISPKCVILARELTPVDDLVSIPKLGTTTLNHNLQENLDYHIVENSIHINNWYSGTLSTQAGSNRVYPDSGVITHPLLSTSYQSTGSLAFLESDDYDIHTLCLGAGDASVYKILRYFDDGSIELDRSLPNDATKLQFWAPRFSAFAPAPDNFWAELSYFDNWKTIENNFGLFIGFPKQLLDEADANVDYLSLTKSVWFAFLSGPHFDNLQLGVQSFFDIPYSEVTGQIVFLEEPTDSEDGTIQILDESNRSYTYTLPKKTTLAYNPSTGQKYTAVSSPIYFELVKSGDTYYQSIDGVQYEIDPSVAEQLESSKIKAYAKIVDVVRVEDYISDQDLLDRQFSGSQSTYVDEEGNTRVVDSDPSVLEKYHKFIVDVPMDVTQSTSVFPLIKQFLNAAKPAYTDFILVGSLRLSDEVSCIDNLLLRPTLTLNDTPHTSPFWAKADGSKTTQNGVDYMDVPKGWPGADDREELIWPKDKTLQKIAAVDYSDLIAQADIEHAPQNYYVTMVGADYHVVFGQSDPNSWSTYEYGSYQQPPQPSVPPLQVPDANLTALGSALYEEPASPARSIGFFVPGTQMFKIFDTPSRFLTEQFPNHGARISITRVIPIASVDMNLLTLNNQGVRFYLFSDTAANMRLNFPPLVTYWDKADVFEKYESGYCEGVLDDYSGDGSWNFRRSTVDMVNSLNSDIDVVRSRVMVPVVRDVTPAQLDVEFELGEPIDIYVDGLKATPTIWDEAPPVLLHIGSGHHPKIPAFDPVDPSKGIFSPQAEHPDTYLLLGFDRSDTDAIHNWEEHSSLKNYNSYGDESRLDVIEDVDATAPINSTLSLVGRNSGAIAVLAESLPTGGVIKRSNPDHVHLPGNPTAAIHPYFLLETIWQQDKLLEYGPTTDPYFTLTKYLPVDSGAGPFPNGTGGISLEDWWEASPSFDGSFLFAGAKYGGVIINITAGGGVGPDPIINTLNPHRLIIGDTLPIWNTDQTTIAPGTVKLSGTYTVTNVLSDTSFSVSSGDPVEAGSSGYLGHSPLAFLGSEKNEKELQQHPYRPGVAEELQFIPSASPGVFSDWNDVVDPITEKLQWGWEDAGPQGVAQKQIKSFVKSTSVSTYLQNIHYGYRIRARKDHHLTHGFTEFYIPPPAIRMIMPSSAGYDLRICGFYFCNDDPSRVNIPTMVPDEYGDPAQQEGVIGGTWVFFRNSATGTEIPVSGYHFEQGEHPGQIISFLGKDRDGASKYIKGGPGQPSDGHVLELHVPANLPGYGYYDIIVRNYRPYQMKVGGDWHYHMDEDSVVKAFYHSEDGWGISPWGTGSFGGV